MQIIVDRYNGRRYGRPWIAKISAWPTGRSPELEWGAYSGSEAGGTLEIECEPGTLIRMGQRGTASQYAIVCGDEALWISDANALAYWRSNDRAVCLAALISKHDAAVAARADYKAWCDEQRAGGDTQWVSGAEYKARNRAMLDALKSNAI